MASPFDAGFQRAVLRLMMVDEQFCVAALRWIDPGFFTVEALGWIYRIFQAYWRDYSRMCPDNPLRGALRFVTDNRASYYQQEIEQVIARGTVPEADWIRDQLADFCRRAEFAVAHRDAAALFNDGKVTEAYDVMAKAQDRIREIVFDTIDRQWFFEELRDRQAARGFDDAAPGFATGIPELDHATSGGIQPGEVWAVLAYQKRGKTTWLVNQGFNALRMHGAPVLHVLLEGNGAKIAARYDSLFSNATYSEVKRGNLSPQSVGLLYEEYARMRRLLVIRTMNDDWNVNMTHVRAEVKELAAHGFKPRLMNLDYVDLMRSRSPGVESEQQHQLDGCRDLVRFAEQEEIAVHTAWQAQRPKNPAANDTKHVLTSASIADCYAKSRIVTAYGSLNATDEEMRAGQMRIFWEAHRDSEIRKLWLVANDLSRSRMIEMVYGTIEEPPPTAVPS
ncbi:MAG TPA: DnaB-like helicase C-terminal domain-containing protein [Opitutaceae bacterium]